MHDKNDRFRLVGYRLVAENRDEERILNLGEFSIQKTMFGKNPEIHLMLSTTRNSASSQTADCADNSTGESRECLCGHPHLPDGTCPICISCVYTPRVKE